MWYTMSKHNVSMQDGKISPIGSIWSARSFKIKDLEMVELLNVDEMAPVGIINIRKDIAKKFFTIPKKDLNVVVEDSIAMMELLYT